MSIDTHRLLGFAFASADLLVEIDAEGRIAFAIGASEALSGSKETSLIGRRWVDFVDPSDRSMLGALFDGLSEGMRSGPVVVALAPAPDGVERAAALSACRLPQNRGAISCALGRAVRPPLGGSGGLHDKAGFEAITATLFKTAKSTGEELELALVEMSGLSAARRAMSPDAAKSAEQRMAGLLRAHSHGGGAAADLGADRYALVRHRTGESPEGLAGRMVKLLNLDPKHEIKATPPRWP